MEPAIHHRPKDSIIDYFLLLIDDDLILHEVVETACINCGMTGRYLIAVALVEPNLQEIFCPLLNIVCLQVINDRHMVDVLSVFRYEFVPSRRVFSFKIFYQQRRI